MGYIAFHICLECKSRNRRSAQQPAYLQACFTSTLIPCTLMPNISKWPYILADISNVLMLGVKVAMKASVSFPYFGSEKTLQHFGLKHVTSC